MCIFLLLEILVDLSILFRMFSWTLRSMITCFRNYLNVPNALGLLVMKLRTQDALCTYSSQVCSFLDTCHCVVPTHAHTLGEHWICSTSKYLHMQICDRERFEGVSHHIHLRMFYLYTETFSRPESEVWHSLSL